MHNFSPIEIYTRILNAIYAGNLPLATALVQESESSLDATNNEVHNAISVGKAELHITCGSPDEALRITALQRTSIPNVQAALQMQSGYALCNLGRLPEAQNELELALSNARACEDLWLEAHTLVRLGTLRFRLRNWRASCQAGRDALAIATKIHDAFLSVVARVVIGKNERELHGSASALAIFEEALADAQANGFAISVAKLQSEIGTCLTLLERIDEAENWFLVAKDSFSQTGSRNSLSVIINSLGHIRLKRNDPSGALGFFHEALALSEEERDIYACARWTHNIGIAHLMLGDRQTASAHFMRSAERFRLAGDPIGMQRDIRAFISASKSAPQ